MSHPDPRQRPTFIEIFQLAGALGLFDQQDWQHVVQAVVPQMRTAAALAMVRGADVACSLNATPAQAS